MVGFWCFAVKQFRQANSQRTAQTDKQTLPNLFFPATQWITSVDFFKIERIVMGETNEKKNHEPNWYSECSVNCNCCKKNNLINLKINYSYMV